MKEAFLRGLQKFATYALIAATAVSVTFGVCQDRLIRERIAREVLEKTVERQAAESLTAAEAQKAETERLVTLALQGPNKGFKVSEKGDKVVISFPPRRKGGTEYELSFDKPEQPKHPGQPKSAEASEEPPAPKGTP